MTCTYVGIKLEKGSMYKSVVAELNKIPEIVECHFTTGPYTMLTKNRGMPLHYRSLHNAYKTVFNRQRASYGFIELTYPGDSWCHCNRNTHIIGAEHQEGNSYSFGK